MANRVAITLDSRASRHRYGEITECFVSALSNRANWSVDREAFLTTQISHRKTCDLPEKIEGRERFRSVFRESMSLSVAGRHVGSIHLARDCRAPL